MKSELTNIGIAIGLIGAVIFGLRGCDNVLNNRSINKPTYHTESRATGITGHIEYTIYSDSSQDVKIYPGLGHRFFGSELHQDMNGDGLVDRIRQDGPELSMHRLNNILVRTHDYQANKERFDKADKQLQGLMEKYPAKKQQF